MEEAEIKHADAPEMAGAPGPQETPVGQDADIKAHTRKEPYILLISGSDSSGGAGMQADIAMARRMNVFPQCAVTCVTAQGARGLTALDPVSPPILRAQLDAALEAGAPASVKVGLLPDRRLAETVADFIMSHRLENVVVDPVLSPTRTGIAIDTDFWLDPDFQRLLLPHVALLTPNLSEFLKISRCSFDGTEMAASVGRSEQYKAEDAVAEWMMGTGLRNLFISNGDSSSDTIREWLYVTSRHNNGIYVTPLTSERIHTRNTHGTGCTFSTALACRLIDRDIPYGIAAAKANGLLREALELGATLRLYDDASAHGPTLFRMPGNRSGSGGRT
ncbi:MAG: hypothetical protein HDR80_04155 [Bacteroides sp.]|nr:hypothetical protein [Bacteroides sp.]